VIITFNKITFNKMEMGGGRYREKDEATARNACMLEEFVCMHAITRMPKAPNALKKGLQIQRG
jgi:hypothetical protein